jgi:hypothetical protein
VALGLIAMIGLIWLRYPDNHGAGPILFRWFFAILFIMSGCHWFFAAKPPVTVMSCALIGFALTWIVDHRNIMVDYDEWIRRGMPEWGQVSKS